jgi:hypothetical protein
MKNGRGIFALVRLREPYESEADFFLRRPDVEGMASDDGYVVLNPYSRLSPEKKASVALNECARLFMRDNHFRPEFDITDEQYQCFHNYGTISDIRETIAARLLSGDPSAGSPTDAQSAFVRDLLIAMTAAALGSDK